MATKPVKRKTPAAPKEETPEHKKLKGKKQERTTALRKLKQGIDKVGAAIKSMQRDMKNVRGKGYPEELCTHLTNRIAHLVADLAEAKQHHAQEVVLPVEREAGQVDQVEASSLALDKSLQILEQKHTLVMQETGSDIKAIAGNSACSSSCLSGSRTN